MACVYIQRFSPTLRGIVVLALTKSVHKTEKKVTFCKLKMSLSRNFVYNLQSFRGFCQVHFTILLQIQHENNFLPTSKE